MEQHLALHCQLQGNIFQFNPKNNPDSLPNQIFPFRVRSLNVRVPPLAPDSFTFPDTDCTFQSSSLYCGSNLMYIG
jgi:hypothetical protein